MAFESGVVPKDWRSAVIAPLYKGKGEKSECKNYRGVSLLSVVGKIYAGVLVDRVRRVTGGLSDDAHTWILSFNCSGEYIAGELIKERVTGLFEELESIL